MIDPAFGHWLAGFTDGEGCFNIRRTTHVGGAVTYQCTLVIALRDDDRSILYECRDRTGLGLVRSRNLRANNDKPSACWMVGRKHEVLALVEIFDRFPLRAKKARDYAIWREAVFEWQKSDWFPADNSAVWERMAALKEQLSDGRRYRGETAIARERPSKRAEPTRDLALTGLDWPRGLVQKPLPMRHS